jgi:hypothetical protein
MSAAVQAILSLMTPEQRRELLTILLREHFAAGEEVEVPIYGAEGETLGYLTPPGVRACVALGLDPKNVPPELRGPLYPAGSILKHLERMEAEAAKTGR